MPTDTKLPTAAVNDPAVGTRPWSNPGRVAAEDGLYASPLTFMAIGEQTQLLRATGFGFAVPADAGPVAVAFRVRRKAVGLALSHDAAARLVLGGAVQAADASQPGAWPGSPGDATYTFAGLSAADVNDPGFGFALAAAVYYTSPPDPEGPARGSTPQVDVIEATATW